MGKDFQKKNDDELKGGKNKLAIRMKNNMDDIHRIQKATEKQVLERQCQCFHCDQNGNPAVFKHPSATNPVTNNPLFVCRICNKYLDIYDVREDEFREAVDRIDRVCDIVKIRFNINDRSSEADLKLYKRTWKTQYFVKTKLNDLYKAARQRNKKKKSSNGSSNFIVTGPSR